MYRLIVLAGIAACAKPSVRVSAHDELAPFIDRTPPPAPIAIENVPPLGEDSGPKPESIARDCRLGPQIRAQFRDHSVHVCGSLQRRIATFEERDAARRCVEQALARDEPFLVEQGLRGIDSEPSTAMIGVLEAGRLAVYVAKFDNGSCEVPYCAGSGTVIRRCARTAVANRERPVFEGMKLRSACERNVVDCFTCEGEQEVARCEFQPPS